jgi:predicted Zn-dependent protease
MLGHEIAHADLRHTTQQLTKTLGLKVILFLFGLNDNLFTDVAQNLVGLSFSRKHEEEADRYSVACLSKTTYNPVAFINFFKKLQVKEKDNLTAFQFLSTHPNPKNRTEYIMQYAQELKCKLNTENKEDYKVFVAMVNKVQNKLTSKKYN